MELKTLQELLVDAQTYATLLGQAEAAALLGEPLQEEEAADQLLPELAEGGLYEAALSTGADRGEKE